jgi:ferredoxin
VALVLAANLFCFSCPMMLTRDAARRFITPRWHWPRWLRGRWLALGLLAGSLFAYELWGVWDRPRATALFILGYFGIAIGVDLLFKGASFCKYVCPVGQFNFVASTLSPTEVQVRETAICGSCATFDCIRGRRSSQAPRHVQARGCELGLFLPAKVGNLDCTMCFDCVRACPHDNIGLVTRVPGTEWLSLQRRSSIGRVAARRDLAAASLAFTSAALFSAFAMTPPATAVRSWLGSATGIASEGVLFALLFAAAVAVMPAFVVATAAAVTPIVDGTTSLLKTSVPFVHALLPLGAGVWLAHYGFHLLTGALTVIPVMQSAAIDATHSAVLGEPIWQWVGLRSGVVFPLQVGVITLAAAGSLGLIAAVSSRDYPDRPARAAAPWMLVALAMTALALWNIAQPMDMRGIAGPG